MIVVGFEVEGAPIPQGSMAAVRGADGRSRMLHSRKRSKTGPTRERLENWRLRARWAARAAMSGEPIDDPVAVIAVFRLERPKSSRAELPHTKPDLDKLQRALGDALEGVVVTQDSRIVHWHTWKVWTDDAPGVTVIVQTVAPAPTITPGLGELDDARRFRLIRDHGERVEWSEEIRERATPPAWSRESGGALEDHVDQVDRIAPKPCLEACTELEGWSKPVTVHDPECPNQRRPGR